MPDCTPSRYSEWLSHLFDHETHPGLPEWYRRDDAATFEATPGEIAELWIAMMKRCETDLQIYSDDQIAHGLCYLFSYACSEHAHQICDGDLPAGKIAEVYGAMSWLYKGLFSSRCTETLTHLSETSSELNSICYMLWDVSSLGWPPENNSKSLFEKALFLMLEEVLQLPHRACIESALHGLGELHCRYPAKVAAVIEPRLASLAQDKDLLQYALNAQQGEVQ